MKNFDEILNFLLPNSSKIYQKVLSLSQEIQMLSTDRYKLILDTLNERGSASIKELSEIVDISESTIRRDIKMLEDEGLLNRVYGGVAAIGHTFYQDEKDMSEKHTLYAEEKDEIGKKAATLVQPGDFVFIDGGTTTEAMIRHLTETDAVYVTDGLVQAQLLVAKKLETVILGGPIRTTTECACGPETLDQLGSLNFSLGFFGVNGITIEAGYTTPDLVEGSVKALAMKQSEKAYVLADESKFGKVYPKRFGRIDQAQIITTERPKDIYEEHLKILEE